MRNQLGLNLDLDLDLSLILVRFREIKNEQRRQQLAGEMLPPSCSDENGRLTMFTRNHPLVTSQLTRTLCH